ncbi:MAG: enoyl-CoA hydratase [Cellvibrionaceae bacterium]|nr:enoyl-CoA hydratase [Cellvibrionaceae bacterium]|tara:strand:- start:35274 stop:36116 length:843 start_codon:yes stop_codon:yes gene_type:complete
MTYQALKVDIDDKIAHIQLNRPDAYNSMNIDFWKELPGVVQEISDAASARVIVLSSTGKHFCAGMDLSVFTEGSSIKNDMEPGRRHLDLRNTVLQLQDVFNRFENARMPVLAAVQGGCIGGAVDMISACDSRYCTEEAFFSIEETKLGMTADLGTMQRLPYLIPQGLVRELAYTGRRMYAEEAKEFGLVNKVYADQQAMLDGVMEIAGQIAARSPLAVTGAKEMINYTRDHNMADSLNAMSLWQSGMYQPQVDMMETFAAKMEKREPKFDDLCPIEPMFK